MCGPINIAPAYSVISYIEYNCETVGDNVYCWLLLYSVLLLLFCGVIVCVYNAITPGDYPIYISSRCTFCYVLLYGHVFVIFLCCLVQLKVVTNGPNKSMDRLLVFPKTLCPIVTLHVLASGKVK